MTPKRNGSSIGRPRGQELEEDTARLSYRTKNPEGRVVKQPIEKSTVSDLVYSYLRKVACITFKKKLQSAAYKKFRKRNARRRTVQDPWHGKSKETARSYKQHRDELRSFRENSMYNEE